MGYSIPMWQGDGASSSIEADNRNWSDLLQIHYVQVEEILIAASGCPDYKDSRNSLSLPLP